jgi:ABC-type uncharacterized transport system permease subunit
MQFAAGVSPEIVDVILALILFLVAADRLVRWMILKRPAGSRLSVLGAGWNRQ